MQANPQETCLSASKKLNIHRKRIAKLLQIIEVLPPDFIERAKEYTDPKILHQMSVNRLFKISDNTHGSFPDKTLLQIHHLLEMVKI